MGFVRILAKRLNGVSFWGQTGGYPHAHKGSGAVRALHGSPLTATNLMTTHLELSLTTPSALNPSEIPKPRNIPKPKP